MKSITKIKFTLLLLFSVLIKQLPAQSFSCPPAYVIANTGTCNIRVNWSITCPAPCATLTCASGNFILIAANTNLSLPCPACLGSCSGCDVSVTLIQVGAIFVIPQITVNSLTTSANGPSLTCCPSPSITNLYWYPTTVRYVCQ